MTVFWQEHHGKHGIYWATEFRGLYIMICWSNRFEDLINIDMRPAHVKSGGDRVTRGDFPGKTIAEAMQWVEDHTNQELFDLTIEKPNSKHGGSLGWEDVISL